MDLSDCHYSSFLALWDHEEEKQVWIKDLDCHYLYANKSLLVNYGLSDLSQIKGKTDYDLSPKYLADVFFKSDMHVIHSGQPMIKVAELVGQINCVLKWVSTSKFPLLNPSKQVIGTIGYNYIIDENVSQTTYSEIGDVIHYINDHISEVIKLDHLAALSNLSVSAFERKFKKILQVTPMQYIKKVRMNLAREKLLNSNESITNIAHDCGFTDHSYMTKEFRLATGFTPREYRKEYSQNK